MPLHFIAILAPDDINRQVLEWKNYMLQQFNCKVALKSPAHITLIPPFHLPDTDHDAMASVLNQLAPENTGFPVHLKNFAAFKPRVIYVHVQPNAPLQELKLKTEDALLQTHHFRIKKEERPFHPHITIANRDLKKEDFNDAWQYFDQLTYEASFTASAISLLRHNGSKWDVAGSFELRN